MQKTKKKEPRVHREVIEYAMKNPVDSGRRWCRTCEDWIHQNEMHVDRLDDERTTEYSCPDCSLLLFAVVLTYEEQ